MGLADAGGARRIDRARALVDRDLLPALSPRFHTEVLRVRRSRSRRPTPRACRRPDRAHRPGRRARRPCAIAIAAAPIAGIVLVTDGGDNGGVDAAAIAAAGAPVYAVGIGPRSAGRDREVVSVTAAESVLSDAMVDVAVSAVAHGYGAAPIELRLLENGRPIDVRRVTPAADGAPVSETFHVSPQPRRADRLHRRDSRRGRRARGGEQRAQRARASRRPAAPRAARRRARPVSSTAFCAARWAADRGLEVDSVARKGRNDSGRRDVLRAGGAVARRRAARRLSRTRATSSSPTTSIVLANVEPDLLTRAAARR